jgi:cytochrome d ubiquinol oxidase subunit I
MVAGGTLLSAFWILSANSWMQTPAGYAVNAAGQYVPVDWWAVIFNPSFPYRMMHMVLAAYLTTAFVVGAVGAWHLLRDRANAEARVMFSMAMWMATIVAPIQAVVGDFHGLNTLQHQPAKIAAIEGHFETQRGAPLILFGWPDMTAERTHYALALPRLGSLILTHEWDGEIKGLKEWPRQDRPNAPIVFWAFRLMVGLGLLMVALGLFSLVQRLRHRLFDNKWLLRFGLVMGPAGFGAVLAGWTVTEVGRQPYVVYGLLRTADAASPIAAPALTASLLAFVLVYAALFGAGTFYILRMMSRPPEMGRGPDPRQPQRAAGIMPGPAQLPGEEGAP